MSICLIVDTNVVMFGFLVKMFDSCGGVDWVHVVCFLQVFWRRVVGIIGLNESDGRIGWNLQMENTLLVQSISFGC